MHELGILVNIVRKVQVVAEENHVTKVEKIVLDVGEVCGVIPEYMKKQFPLAVLNNPMFEDCALEMSLTKAYGRCNQCKKIYRLKQSKGVCPFCGGEDFYTNKGMELLIKEIVAY